MQLNDLQNMVDSKYEDQKTAYTATKFCSHQTHLVQ